MSQLTENVLVIMEENAGMLTLKEARSENINPKQLQRMSNQGFIERVSDGIYLHLDYFEDPYYIFQHRAPQAIFSHETAFYLHNLSDENPTKITATIPSGYNSTMIKERDKYHFYYLKEELWNLGHETIVSPFGKEVEVYSKEMTLIQMISKLDQLDKDLVLTAFKRALKNK